MLKELGRSVAHVIFRIRSFNNRYVGGFARRAHGLRILEIGSGKSEEYSARRFFDGSNEFVKSDVVPEYGHNVVDATRMTFADEFDAVLCTCVLEHIYDVRSAVENMWRALKPGGTAVIVVPGLYPLHDEPHDYWRFTEHSLRLLLKDFRRVSMRRSGLRHLPIAYYIEAVK